MITKASVELGVDFVLMILYQISKHSFDGHQTVANPVAVSVLASSRK